MDYKIKYDKKRKQFYMLTEDGKKWISKKYTKALKQKQRQKQKIVNSVKVNVNVPKSIKKRVNRGYKKFSEKEKDKIDDIQQSYRMRKIGYSINTPQPQRYMMSRPDPLRYVNQKEVEDLQRSFKHIRDDVFQQLKGNTEAFNTLQNNVNKASDLSKQERIKLQHEIDSYAIKIKSHEEEIYKLNEQISSLVSETNTHLNELKSIIVRIEPNEALEKIEELRSQTKKEIDALKHGKANVQTTKDLNSFKIRIDAELNEMKEDIDKKIEKHEEALDELNEELSSLKTQTITELKELKSIIDRIDPNEALEKIEELRYQTEEEIASLIRGKASNQTTTKLNRFKERVDGELNEMKEHIEKHEKQFQEINEQISSLVSETNTHLNELKSIIDRIDPNEAIEKIEELRSQTEDQIASLKYGKASKQIKTDLNRFKERVDDELNEMRRRIENI